MQPVFRLRRSVLSVPAHKEKMVAKAVRRGADQVMLDLEDSVPPGEKAGAREVAAESLASLEWGRVTRSLRINAMDTPFAYRDLVDVVERAGDHLDTVVVPKVRSARDIGAVALFLEQIEANIGLRGGIGLEAIVEDAQGMLRVEEIATATERLEVLVFGVADYGASLRMPSRGASGHGEVDPDYPGHKWHYPLSRLIMAARAAGLHAVDAPFGDYRDREGLERSCRMSAALGYDGKWAVHPDQVETVNRVFSPEEADYERCRRILEAFERARARGEGAISLDGQMVDAASVRVAREVCAKWERIRERRGDFPEE
jgi:citrate lyase beta subunit